MRKIVNYIIVLLAVFCIQGITVYAEESSYDFDYIRYAEENPDLKQVYGYDKNALYEHYINIGKSEGRMAYFEGGARYFDYMAYLEMYPELEAAYGNDYEKLYIHYMTIGKNEGRTGVFYPVGYGTMSNKKVKREGNIFFMEGLPVVTTNEPFENHRFSNPLGGFPMVMEQYDEEGCYINVIFEINKAVGYGVYSHYTEKEFISDCFGLFTDSEKIAYIQYALTNNEILSYPALVWLKSTNYYSLDEKVKIIEQCGVVPLSEYYNEWVWDVYASKLPNGTKMNNVIKQHFKSIGNELKSVAGSDEKTYLIPEKDMERYRTNGAISKQKYVSSFFGGAWTQEKTHDCINPAKIDCERWYIL